MQLHGWEIIADHRRYSGSSPIFALIIIDIYVL